MNRVSTRCCFEFVRTDQELLSAARQFAQAAAPFEAAFVAHGLLPSSITDAARAFETALRNAGMYRDDHMTARVRIRQLLASASAYIRTLDVIVKNHLGGDMMVQAVWRQARHVDQGRRRRRAATAPETTMLRADAAVGERPQVEADLQVGLTNKARRRESGAGHFCLGAGTDRLFSGWGRTVPCPHRRAHPPSASRRCTTLRATAGRSSQGTKTAAQGCAMLPCPHCHCEQLYRVRRTALERVLFIRSYGCRMCGHRARVVRDTGFGMIRRRVFLLVQRLNAPVLSVRIVLPLRAPRYGGEVVRASS